MVIENKTNDIVSNNSPNDVYVTLKYEGNLIKFPINPENLKEVIDSNATVENIEGIGEISVPQRPSLSTISFSSFFWADRDNIRPREYVKWIKDWQKSKKPANLSVSVIDWNIDVTCESFSHWVNAGEEDDIYFTITLKEYRKYGAKRVKLVGNQYILDENGLQTVLGRSQVISSDNHIEPVLFGSKGIRDNINKRNVPLSVMVGENESIISITKRYSSEGTKNWRDLYNENKETIANGISQSIEGAKEATEFAEDTAQVKSYWDEAFSCMKKSYDLSRLAP